MAHAPSVPSEERHDVYPGCPRWFLTKHADNIVELYHSPAEPGLSVPDSDRRATPLCDHHCPGPSNGSAGADVLEGRADPCHSPRADLNLHWRLCLGLDDDAPRMNDVAARCVAQ